MADWVSALVLLIGVGFSPWLELLFPVWILALSVDILAAGLRPAAPSRADRSRLPRGRASGSARR